MAARASEDLSPAQVPAAEPPQVVVTINGPGEISAWLYPFSIALKRRMPGVRICVCLLPCVFSSGAELGVLDGFETVDAACSTRDSYRLILANRLPEGFSRTAPTLLFHFGGEVALTRAIRWRLGCRAWAYADHAMPGGRAFQRIFYSGLTGVDRRAPGKGADFVGELMVDAARLRRAAARGDRDGRTTIGLFPGSREYMVRHLLPFLAVAADELAARHPDLRFVIAQSDFVRAAFLRDFPEPLTPRSWRAHRVRHASDGDARWMQTEAGTRLELMGNSEVLAQADLAVSLPGTNTGEMAAAGIPMVAILPTHLAELAPLPGLAGHVGRLPVVGRALKRHFAARELKRYPLLSQPNRRAGRKIVPELVGRIDPGEIAEALETLLSADRAALSAAVQEAMGAAGAAERLADAVAGYFANA